MTIVGITGNSGAGKDTVSSIVKNELDAVILDADSLTRNEQKIGTSYYDSIIQIFGEGILLDDGNIDRKELARIIFTDEEKRDELNDLTFDIVKDYVEDFIEENRDKKYIILNFPLLYEGEFDKICKVVIAVVADEDTKLKRIILRDHITATEARERIASQESEDFFRKHADYIIDNSNNINYSDLKKEIIAVTNKIKEG